LDKGVIGNTDKYMCLDQSVITKVQTEHPGVVTVDYTNSLCNCKTNVMFCVKSTQKLLDAVYTDYSNSDIASVASRLTT